MKEQFEIAHSMYGDIDETHMSLYIEFDNNRYRLIYAEEGNEVFELPLKENYLTIFYNTLKHKTKDFMEKYDLSIDSFENMDKFELWDYMKEKSSEWDNFKIRDIRIFFDSNITLIIEPDTNITLRYHNCRLKCFNDLFSSYGTYDDELSAVNIFGIILMNRLVKFLKSINREGVVA